MQTAPSLPATACDLPVANIRPNPRNPRRLGLDTASIAEMVRSIQAEGLLEPVLVRELEQTPLAGTFYELIAGERRWRAFKMMGADHIPARVLAADEASAAAKCLVGFLQSKSATPMEEAVGYRRALDLRDAQGVPVFTVAELSRRTGRPVQTIAARLILCDLPEEGQTAILEGKIDASAAREVARLPEPAARAAALRAIMGFDPPLSHAGVCQLLDERYKKDLRSAPFDRDDAALLPAAGACTTCPHRTGANPERFGLTSKAAAHVCTRPDCYRAKVDAARVKEAEALAATGLEVLDAEACEVEWPTGAKGLRWDSPFVDLLSTPSPDLLKKEVTSPPTWDELIERSKVKPPVLAGFDQSGKVVRLVRRDQAIAAVDALPGERHIFRKSDRDAARPGRTAEAPRIASPEPKSGDGAGEVPATVSQPAPVDLREEVLKAVEAERDELAGLLKEVWDALPTGALPQVLRIRLRAKLVRYGKEAA